jgi:mutator protein MutT
MINNQDLELLDVFDEKNEKRIGMAERGVVHYYNLWHREIACWIINDKNEILLQRRSKNKKQQPNKLAVTAGHVGLGETPAESLLREVSEEIGINDVEEKDFIYLDTFKAENPNNYHFKYVYLLKTSKKLEELTIQKSEVSELLYVSLDKLKEMIELPNSELTFAKKFYTPIILNKIEEML